MRISFASNGISTRNNRAFLFFISQKWDYQEFVHFLVKPCFGNKPRESILADTDPKKVSARCGLTSDEMGFINLAKLNAESNMKYEDYSTAVPGSAVHNHGSSITQLLRDNNM